MATSPTLGAVASYSVLGATTVTNTGSTIIAGDLGVSPGTEVTGFPPGTVELPGTIHLNDSSAQDAQLANGAAFLELDQACTTTYTGAQELSGLTLVAGVYCADSFSLSGTLTLSGTGVWIFKSASTLTTSGSANIVGGDPCNTWWRVVSSATLGVNTSLIGSVLASASISAQTGASLDGRALAQTGAVTLDTSDISGPTCGLRTIPDPTATPTLTPTATATATLIPAPPVPTATRERERTPRDTRVPEVEATTTPSETETPLPASATPDLTTTIIPDLTTTITPELTTTITPELTTTITPELTMTITPELGVTITPGVARLPNTSGTTPWRENMPWIALLAAGVAGIVALALKRKTRAAK